MRYSTSMWETVLSPRWEVQGWQSEMKVGLHCLLSTEEGDRLSQAINMFQVLSSARLDLTQTEL